MAEQTQVLSSRKIAFLVAPEGIEQVELARPWEAVEQAGGTAELVSTSAGAVQAFNHLDKADTFDVDHTVDEVSVEDYEEEVVVDQGLITSRNPDDLPAFCEHLVVEFGKAEKRVVPHPGHEAPM
jgi:putative intracellular protease/amidase